jgi:oligopeptide transport system permease protein
MDGSIQEFEINRDNKDNKTMNTSKTNSSKIIIKRSLKEKSISPGVDALKRLLKNKMAVLGGSIILIMLIMAIFAPFIAPKHYSEGDLELNYDLPGTNFVLGADFMGRDLLSRLIYGTRISLTIAFLGAFTAFIIGIIYGTISGYVGGRTDNIMMRIVDIIYAFPTLLLIILLMVVFKTSLSPLSQGLVIKAMVAVDSFFGGLFFIMIGIGMTSWVGIARIARGMTLSLRETDYVQAARAIGAKNLRLIFKHIMPNLIGPLIVSVTFQIPRFIATEAFLSFIGLGVDPPTPSWGMMISEGYKTMRSYPHLAIYPGIALALIMLAFNFLGDGLRDALDPKLKQ